MRGNTGSGIDVENITTIQQCAALGNLGVAGIEANGGSHPWANFVH